MLNFLQFLIQYRDVFVFVILLILYVFQDFNAFRKQLFAGMLIAKKKAADGILTTGIQQENWIIENIIKLLSARFMLYVGIIGEQNLRAIIKTLYDDALSIVGTMVASDLTPSEAPAEPVVPIIVVPDVSAGHDAPPIGGDA